MARRSKNNDNMKTAAIAAVIALVVVLVFNGGAITGNATSTFDIEATVTASLGCSSSPADIEIGAVTANTESSTGTLTIENTGTGNIDISFQAETDPNTDFGSSSGSAIEIKHTGGSGNGTVATSAINLSDASKSTAMLTGVASADSTDDEVFSVAVFPAADTSVVGTEISLDVTTHCE